MWVVKHLNNVQTVRDLFTQVNINYILQFLQEFFLQQNLKIFTHFLYLYKIFMSGGASDNGHTPKFLMTVDSKLFQTSSLSAIVISLSKEKQKYQYIFYFKLHQTKYLFQRNRFFWISFIKCDELTPLQFQMTPSQFFCIDFFVTAQHMNQLFHISTFLEVLELSGLKFRVDSKLIKRSGPSTESIMTVKYIYFSE